MSPADTGMRVAGAWLAIASVLLGFVLVGHGPIHPDLAQQMQVIASGVTLWVVVHWAAAAALSLFVVASLIVLTAGSRLTERVGPIVGGGFRSARFGHDDRRGRGTPSRSRRRNDMADSRSGGRSPRAGQRLHVPLPGGCRDRRNEALSRQQVTPTWASLVGVVAGLGAFVGWPLGMWFGIGLGSLVWVASSFVMALWTLWFGLGLARTEISASTAARSARSSA